MADLQKGTTFTDGATSWHAADFNNLVDAATILPAFITAKTDIAPVGADSFIFYKSSAADFRKCTLTELITGIPTDGAAGTASLRTLGTAGTQAAPGNDSRFGVSVTGLRKSAGAPSTDVAAAPKDLAFASSNLTGGTSINWDTADIFYDTLTGSTGKTYTFSNVRDGRVISVELDLSTYTGTITWPTLFGTTPAQTNGSKMIYTFTKSGISTNPKGVSKSI